MNVCHGARRGEDDCAILSREEENQKGHKHGHAQRLRAGRGEGDGWGGRGFGSGPEAGMGSQEAARIQFGTYLALDVASEAAQACHIHRVSVLFMGRVWWMARLVYWSPGASAKARDEETSSEMGERGSTDHPFDPRLVFHAQDIPPWSTECLGPAAANGQYVIAGPSSSMHFPQG